MISVVLPYGIDRSGREWTVGADLKGDTHGGVSHPTNKANLVALWLLALTDATGEQAYRDRAAAWFWLMKRRLHLRDDGDYEIWNYWEPAGLWDYTASGRTKHWVGVHRNAGYYDIDAEAMVAAFEHGIVFTAEDLDHLIRTAIATRRFWPALAPYSIPIRTRVAQTLDPDSWEGLSLLPWYLAVQAEAQSGAAH